MRRRREIGSNRQAGPVGVAEPCGRRSARTGFTLIELLIVVAIIAILAAIAVPNFHEAQIRSKISRVKNDLRAIATAVEAYMVDNRKYPPTAMFAGDASVNYPAGFFAGRGGATLLTTPVAYLASYPLDPFPDFQGWTSGNTQHVGMPDRPYYYDQISPASAALAHGHRPYRGDAERAMGLKWALFSCGPTRRRKGVPGSMSDEDGWYFYLKPRRAFPSALQFYDPTNGTVSVGAIARYSAGEIHRYDPEP